MTRRRRQLRISAGSVIGVVMALVLAACAGQPAATPDEAAGTPEPEPSADAPSAADSETSGGGPRLAAVFPGTTTDADYNTLGLLALEEAEAEFGAEVAYSESVPVPDVERAMREYAADGYDIVWSHGSQFYEQTVAVAEEFPDVVFIAESDGEPENPPDNLWVIDRNFHIGFYPLGALAGMLTQTGTVGYLGGLSLPFSYSEVHAMEQAIADEGLDVELTPVWSGDFNDPAAARQLAGQLLSQDVDVIVGSLNLGMVGVFEAVAAEEPGQAWVTAKYTDKSQFAPEHYVTSIEYDFTGPMADIVGAIQEGETGGYYPLGFDTGVAVRMPLQNVPDEVNAEMERIVEAVESGDTVVEKNVTPIE